MANVNVMKTWHLGSAFWACNLTTCTCRMHNICPKYYGYLLVKLLWNEQKQANISYGMVRWNFDWMTAVVGHLEKRPDANCS